MSEHGLNTWQGWRTYCDRSLAQRPAELSLSAYRQLNDSARMEYNKQRHHFHANMPPVKHAQMKHVHDLLDLVRYTNPSMGYAARNALVVDGEPTVGKTTTVVSYARELDRDIRRTKGDRTDVGRHRIPVVRVGLSGSPSMKDLSMGIAHFLGIPDGGGKMTRERLTSTVVDKLAQVETELVIFDDIHCVRVGTRDGSDLADYFKRLADDVAATCVFVGVDLESRGFYDSTNSSTSTRLAQTSRRWTLARPERFSITAEAGQKEWKSLVRRLSSMLVLLDNDKSISHKDIELAYERTGGSLGSLIQLFTRAGFLAINSGEERLTTELLGTVPIDLGAHAGQSDHAGELKAIGRSKRAKANPDD